MPSASWRRPGEASTARTAAAGQQQSKMQHMGGSGTTQTTMPRPHGDSSGTTQTMMRPRRGDNSGTTQTVMHVRHGGACDMTLKTTPRLHGGSSCMAQRMTHHRDEGGSGTTQTVVHRRQGGQHRGMTPTAAMHRCPGGRQRQTGQQANCGSAALQQTSARRASGRTQR